MTDLRYSDDFEAHKLDDIREIADRIEIPDDAELDALLVTAVITEEDGSQATSGLVAVEEVGSDTLADAILKMIENTHKDLLDIVMRRAVVRQARSALDGVTEVADDD